VRVVILVAVVAPLACSSSHKSSNPWHKRPLHATTAAVGNHQVRLTLPAGLRRFDDPHGVSWSDVAPDYAFFVKVFSGKFPANVAAAAEDLMFEDGDKVVGKQATAAGYEVIVQTPATGRHKVVVWKRNGAVAVKCSAFTGIKTGDAAVDTSDQSLAPHHVCVADDPLSVNCACVSWEGSRARPGKC